MVLGRQGLRPLEAPQQAPASPHSPTLRALSTDRADGGSAGRARRHLGAVARRSSPPRPPPQDNY